MALVLLKKFDLKERAYLILSGHNAADNYAWTPRVFLSETRNRLANGSSSFIVDDENPNRVGRLYESCPSTKEIPRTIFSVSRSTPILGKRIAMRSSGGWFHRSSNPG